MTTTPPPATAVPEAGQRRPRRSGPSRILFGYAVVLLATAVGSIGLLIGLLGMDQCTADGFECLNWLILGLGLWVLISTAALFVLAHLARLGWLFAVVALVLVGAGAAVPGEEWMPVLVALLAPLVAALLTAPRTGPADPQAPADPAPRRRWWLIGVVGVLVVVTLLGASVAWRTVSLVNHRTDLYTREGVQPVGLVDDRGWTYPVVIESVTSGAGFSYQMEDGSGNDVSVEITEKGASAYDPPQDCSPDPHQSAGCEELAPGVWADASLPTRRVTTTEDAVVTVQHDDGPMTDAELTDLTGQLEPKTPRWLATRDCRICRLL